MDLWKADMLLLKEDTRKGDGAPRPSDAAAGGNAAEEMERGAEVDGMAAGGYFARTGEPPNQQLGEHAGIKLPNRRMFHVAHRRYAVVIVSQVACRDPSEPVLLDTANLRCWGCRIREHKRTFAILGHGS